jgi:hypothetical protein
LVPFGEPFAIKPANVLGDIYPERFVQPLKVLENILSALVVILLNNPAGMLVSPVHPENVLPNIETPPVVMLLNKFAGIDVKPVHPAKVRKN